MQRFCRKPAVAVDVVPACEAREREVGGVACAERVPSDRAERLLKVGGAVRERGVFVSRVR